MPMPVAAPFRHAALVAALAALAACGGDAPATAPDPEPPGPPPGGVTVTPATWLAAHAHPLASVRPEDRDFRDLEPLRDAIGNARIVMLGEQTHGDGTTFLAKARIIQFLHEEMGFDVLAWESGIYHLHWADRAVRGGDDPIAAQRQAIFGVWARSQQVQPLFAYVAGRRSAASPLTIAGFDPQASGQMEPGHLARDLAALADRIGFHTADASAWTDFLALADALATLAEHVETTPPAQRTEYRATLATLREAVQAYAHAHDDRDARMWGQILTSMEVQATLAWMPRSSGSVGPEYTLLRDAQMARNLAFLADTLYAGRRIIVWAATFHIARDLRTLRRPGSIEPFYTDERVMGEDVHARFGDQAYALGFTAHEGVFGHAGRPTTPLSLPAAGSLEALMHQAGFLNAFLDFRGIPAGGEWLRGTITMRPLGYTAMEGEWARALDGVVYTRVMEPSRLRDP